LKFLYKPIIGFEFNAAFTTPLVVFPAVLNIVGVKGARPSTLPVVSKFKPKVPF
jgi:hypothetical protein